MVQGFYSVKKFHGFMEPEGSSPVHNLYNLVLVRVVKIKNLLWNECAVVAGETRNHT